ncbi:MAG: DJ-1/PfpI family protein [Chloroflexota bacterium]|nr:DJ-1/PfpI family protein [Chloroflexota bacterium]MBI5704138.1 DJ-1/PfpI family protein [Chloroflexota bacterium]
MNIGIYLYDNAEVLDFAGPFEVFTTASRVHARQKPGASLFDVSLIAEREGLIHARADFKVQPHYTIQNHPRLDVLIIPGGVHTAELEKPAVIEWIRKTANSIQLTASVCTGAFLLAKAGMLQDKSCTTHWEDIPDLRAMFPTLDIKEDVPWVDNGRVVTSAGISAGIEMALHLVAKLAGKELALRTARQMQYVWNNQHLSKETQ